MKQTKKRAVLPLAIQLKKAQKKIRFLKIKLFFLVALPIAIIAVANAVLKEYVKIRVRQAAGKGKADIRSQFN